MSQFFYDGQLRRYLTQITRLMSNFYWEDSSGNLKQIPVMYGDMSRQVASILKDNSENKVISTPRMAVYMTGLEMDRSRTGDSSLVSKVHIRERAFDANNNQYLNEQGKNYTVERLMPTPYKLTVKVDIWTSSENQKLQVLEQIFMLFNPSLEIQTNDNFLDWTSLSVVYLEDITLTNRNIPVGADTDIDIASLTFTTPIYISPPAKVKRLGVITNIITSIFTDSPGSIELGLSEPQLGEYGDTPVPEINKASNVINSDGTVNINTNTYIDAGTNGRSTLSTTYRDYGLYVEGSQAQLISDNSIGTVNWNVVLQAYPGEYKANVSQIRLRIPNTNNFVIGTFALNSTDNTKINVTWDADTIPSNTIIPSNIRNANSLSSVDYIIDPGRYNPTGVKQPGLRLLLLGPIGNVGNPNGPAAWKNSDGSDFYANENDIIEWSGTKWSVVFDSQNTTSVIYINNLNTNIQYRWSGSFWIKSYEGEYSGGTWMIYLNG